MKNWFKMSIYFVVFSLVFNLAFAFSEVNVYANEVSKTEEKKVNEESYKAGVLMEVSTGKLLQSTNKDEKLKIASVTKVMTLLLIFDALKEEKIKLDDVVTISENASQMGGSQVFLEPMEKQTVNDLIKTIVVASANDSSVAMAELIAGSEDAFVEMMNKKAKELGMKNTKFANATGLDEDDNQYSSANDVAIMSTELLRNHPEIYNYTKIWQDTIIHKTKRGDEEFTLSNTNKFIRHYEGATGLKTGSTSVAKFNLSASANRDGMDLVAVVLGAENPTIRMQGVISMLDFGFSNYQVIEPFKKDEVIAEVPVKKGSEKLVEAKCSGDGKVVVKKGEKEIEKEVQVVEEVVAPIQKDTKLGEVIFRQNGEVVEKVDLVATKSIEKATMKDSIFNVLDIWFS